MEWNVDFLDRNGIKKKEEKREKRKGYDFKIVLRVISLSDIQKLKILQTYSCTYFAKLERTKLAG